MGIDTDEPPSADELRRNNRREAEKAIHRIRGVEVQDKQVVSEIATVIRLRHGFLLEGTDFSRLNGTLLSADNALSLIQAGHFMVYFQNIASFQPLSEEGLVNAFKSHLACHVLLSQMHKYLPNSNKLKILLSVAKLGFHEAIDVAAHMVLDKEKYSASDFQTVAKTMNQFTSSDNIYFQRFFSLVDQQPE
jgi:hypothetical protein